MTEHRRLEAYDPVNVVNAAQALPPLTDEDERANSMWGPGGWVRHQCPDGVVLVLAVAMVVLTLGVTYLHNVVLVGP